MTEKTLSTGKIVYIRKLSRVDIRKIKDLGSQRLFPDGSIGVLGDWKASNGEVAPDDIIMQLNETEQFELSELIKSEQIVNPTKPSSSD
jgi:hypothetical protein